MNKARSSIVVILLLLAIAGAASAQAVFQSPSPLPDGIVGIPYSVVIEALLPVTNWRIAKGALPAGTAIDNNGNISGTPTVAGTVSFTVSVQDASTQATYTMDYAITIQPALAITSPLTLPPVTVGGNYSITLQQANGLAPFTWFLQVPLPPGLSLSSSGILSGIPTTAGTSSFLVYVHDNGDPNQVASATFSLTVNPPASGSGQLPNGFVGQTYSQVLPLTGGTGPFVFTLSGRELPPGLSLSPGGALTGIPTTPGSYRVAAIVKDAYGILGGGSYSVSILPSGVSIVTDVLPGGTVGQAYSQTLAATGGQSPYQWSRSDGALPAGLTLDPASGTISGTPTTAGISSVSIRVTDAAGSVASRTFRITIVAGGPVITTTSLPTATFGMSYSQTLTAVGGTPPYFWLVDTGSLPRDLTLNGGVIFGVPLVSGTSTFTVRVIDANQATTTKVLSLTVGPPPPVPPVLIHGIPGSVPSAQQTGNVVMELAVPYPTADITGTLNLDFAPAVPNGDDPAVQFSTGGRSVNFTFPASFNQTFAEFSDPAGVSVQTGTVTGVITLTVHLTVSGIDVTPNPAPTITIQIPPAVPVITTLAASRTASGVSVSATGFSNTRDMTTATFSFPQTSGTNVAGTSIAIPAGPLFSPYYAAEASIPFGSIFTYVQTFTIQGTASDVQQVGLILTNSVGASTQVTIAIQ